MAYGEADHVDIADVLQSLGRTVLELGDLDRAGQLLEKCAEMNERTLGSTADHTNVADVFYQQGEGELVVKKNVIDDSARLFAESFAMFGQVYGAEVVC